MSQGLPIKIIVSDTAFLIRKGLRTLIKEDPRFEYVTEVVDTKSLQQALKKELPDVLIVDHCCDDCFSLNVIKSIRREYPELHVLVISHEKTADEIKKIIGTGIKNYLLKDCDEQEITDAIISCAKGEKYFCGQIIDVLLEKEISSKEHCMTGSITEREIDVIRELVSGKRPKEIADILNISYYTIVTHKKNIYKKLGINHSIELAQYAVKTGLMK
ncbi:MAG: response regulator transcription factor [Bacteroidia bacterium]|nr:response regulator transcription factor [Bacteroidia bacterium]